jgi:S1-C subfamily serine protease
MRKHIVTSLIALALLIAPLKATDWADVVRQVERSVVYVEIGSQGACTGFVINQEKHYVMTAAHCQPGDNGALWVDRVPAKVVSMDSKKDLLVVEAKDLDPTRPALKLAAKNPERGQEVMSVGYGFALERPFFRQAHVQDDALMIPQDGVGGPYISTDSPFVGGQSGGPVVNAAGEVVLIVQRGDGGTTGLGVGVDIIRDRMGRFFEKVK